MLKLPGLMLYIRLVFQVDKSRQFRREGADVHSDILISLSQAVLGGTIKIASIYDDVLLNVSIYSFKSNMDHFFGEIL